MSRARLQDGSPWRQSCRGRVPRKSLLTPAHARLGAGAPIVGEVTHAVFDKSVNYDWGGRAAMAASSRSLLDPRTASMASLVRSSESGHKWLYVSRVSEALA